MRFGHSLAGLLILAGSLSGCATGRLPDLPAAAEYDRPCEELFAEYRALDEKAQNRKMTVYSVDSAIALTAIGVTVASSGAAGPGVPIAAVVLSQAKGDLGHENIAVRRGRIQQMAIRKGCSLEDVKAAEKALEAAPPMAAAASN